MTIGGTTFTKGFGVLAQSSLTYQLNGECTTFSATIGLDDEVGSAGSVIFQLWTDGNKKIYDSGTLTGDDRPVTMSKPVSGKQVLELRVVHPNGEPATPADVANWGNAKLVCNN
jgi:hypothetical protein